MRNRLVIVAVTAALVGIGCGVAQEGASPQLSDPVDVNPGVGAELDVTSSPDDYVPPAAVIYEPQDGQLFQHGQPIELVGKVGAAGTDSGAPKVHWVSDLAGVIWDGEGSASGVVTWTWEGASPGSHTVTLLSIDSRNEVATTTVTILVNDVPTPPIIELEPQSPTTADDLTVALEVLAQDANKDDILTYNYLWYRSGQPMLELAEDTVSNKLTTRGDTWKVEVTVSDGHHISEKVSDEVVVVNAVPSYLGAAILPSSGGVSTLFTCAGTWWSDPDGDPEMAEYLWEVNGQEVPLGKEATLPSGLIVKGDWIRCGVTPFDGFAFGETIFSPEVTIDNTPPVLGVTELSPVTGDVTTNFTCIHGDVSDPDEGDQAMVDTVWFLDGILQEEVSGATLIPGSIGATGGQVLTCQGWPTDGFSLGLVSESQAVTLNNAAPTIGEVTVIVDGGGETTTEAGMLFCQSEAVVDPDGEIPVVSVRWMMGDDWIMGQGGEPLESPTLDGGFFDKGDVIRCRVSAEDPGGAVAQKESANSIFVVNTPPQLASVSLGPPMPSKNTELTCSAGAWTDVDPADSDPDSLVVDPMDTASPALLVAWLANGELIPGVEGSTYTASSQEPGTEIQCEITPFDGQGSGAAVTSQGVVLNNNPPSVEAVHLEPLPAYGNTTLECVPTGWFDEDGDPPDYVYGWTINGEVLPFAQGAHLPPPWFVKGDTVQCHVTPWDGYAEGQLVASELTEILNQPPGLSGVQLIPETGGKNTTFTCLVNDVFDVDTNDEVTFVYTWYLADGSLIEDQEGATLYGGVPPLDVGFYCEVVPYDGTEFGSTYASDQSMVVNAPPSLEGAVLTPEDPTTLAELTCVPQGFFDPDGDPPVYEFKE